jgi:hypothetical protein
MLATLLVSDSQALLKSLISFRWNLGTGACLRDWQDNAKRIDTPPPGHSLSSLEDISSHVPKRVMLDSPQSTIEYLSRSLGGITQQRLLEAYLLGGLVRCKFPITSDLAWTLLGCSHAMKLHEINLKKFALTKEETWEVMVTGLALKGAPFEVLWNLFDADDVENYARVVEGSPARVVGADGMYMLAYFLEKGRGKPDTFRLRVVLQSLYKLHSRLKLGDLEAGSFQMIIEQLMYAQAAKAHVTSQAVVKDAVARVLDLVCQVADKDPYTAYEKSGKPAPALERLNHWMDLWELLLGERTEEPK